MPIFSLDDEDQKRLASQPETGMGFQILETSILGCDAKLYVAFGSRLLLPSRNLEELGDGFRQIADSGASTPDEIKSSPTKIGAELKVIASRLDSEIGIDERVRTLLAPQPLVVKVRSVPVRAYFRYLAFPNDPRVLSNGDFTASTYATTFNDVRMVPSGFAAVGRYALPNPLSAKYVYIILTDTMPCLIGTTVPNYGQAGGGVEVLFKGGATAKYGQPHEIAES